LPQELAKGGEQAYRKMAGQGGAWILSTSLGIGLYVFLSSFFQHGTNAAFYAPAFRLLGCVIVVGAVRLFLGVCLSAREEFRSSTIGSMVLDAVSLIAAIVLLFRIGILGLVWAVLVAEIAGSLYYLFRLGFFPLELHWNQVWPMIREGGLAAKTKFTLKSGRRYVPFIDKLVVRRLLRKGIPDEVLFRKKEAPDQLHVFFNDCRFRETFDAILDRWLPGLLVEFDGAISTIIRSFVDWYRAVPTFTWGDVYFLSCVYVISYLCLLNEMCHDASFDIRAAFEDAEQRSMTKVFT
jgi:hypothetical protein